MFLCACVCVCICGLGVSEETISFSVVQQPNSGLGRLFLCDVKCSDVEWTGVIYVKWFCFEVKWSEVSYGEVLEDKYIRVTVLYVVVCLVMWLYYCYVIIIFIMLCSLLA
jgi:hypothetical protein